MVTTAKPRTRAPRPPVKKVTPINRPTKGLIALDSVAPEKVKWLWPQYLPAGKLVILDGDPSTGKSTLTMDLAARVSAGLPWPDGEKGIRGGAGVLLLTAEDGLADTIVPRLKAAGGDTKKVFVLSEVPTDDGTAMQPPSLPRDIPRIEKEVKTHKVKLIVVDVLMAFLTANSTNDQAVRAVFSRLKTLAEESGCTIILIRHVTKGKNKNSLYRGSGSIGIVGAARAAYLLSRDPGDEDRRILRTTKNNLAMEAPARAYRLVDVPEFECARVEWEPDAVMDNDYDLDANAKTERDEAAEFIVGLLEENGPMSRADIMANAAGAGFSVATIKRAKDRAGIRHKSEGFPRKTVWYIP